MKEFKLPAGMDDFMSKIQEPLNQVKSLMLEEGEEAELSRELEDLKSREFQI